MDITEIKRALDAKARPVAEHLLPNGKLESRYWCVGSVAGEAGNSLRICVSGDRKGLWGDFAAAGESGDLIDLWCSVKGVGLVVALSQIREFLGVASPSFEKKEKRYKLPDKPKCTVPKGPVRDYLVDQRKLTEDVIKRYRIGEQDTGTIVFPCLLPDGTLPLIKYRTLAKKIWASAESEPILFGWQAIDSEAREVTITESEIDAMTASDYNWPALSVPFGGGSGGKQQWIESEFERMSQFEVIYLALDMDKEGNAAVEEIANRLGRHRCRRVMLPMKDINECRISGIGVSEIRACFETAKTLDPPELVQPGSFADAVVNLFWPTDGLEPGYRLPFYKSGERLVFRPGEISEWTGATGMGKSQILSYALIAMGQQGARACMASLEMAPAQLIRRMVKQAGNTDRPTEEFIREIISWLDEWLWMFGLMGKVSVSRLIEVFEYARCRYDCDVFGIDSLMRLGVSSEDYEGQEKAVFELVNWAVIKNVHVHLVAHARKGDRFGGGVPDAEDIKGTSEIANNASNIIGIWRHKKLEEEVRVAAEAVGRGDAAMQETLDGLVAKPSVMVNVAKQRNGDWEGKFGLWFNTATYQYRSEFDDRLGRRFVSLGKKD